MLRVLARSLAKAGRPVVVRISSIGVLEARRLFSVSTDSDSHEDFQPKKKVQAAPSSAELFPTIEKIVSSHPVVLFMKGTPQQPMCGFSAQVVRLLNHHGVDIHGEDVLSNSGLRQAMKEFSSWPTFPQVYVNGEFIGGCDIVTQMHQSGELAELLKDLKAKIES